MEEYEREGADDGLIEETSAPLGAGSQSRPEEGMTASAPGGTSEARGSRLQQEAKETPVATNELAAARQRIAELEQELARERDKATEYMHNWQRAQADFNNFRRRNKQEQEALAKYASTELLYDLLPVLDNFARAFQTLPAALRDFTWINGIALTEFHLHNTLQHHGVTRIEAVGKEFNPQEHQAMMHEETAEAPEHTVLEEFQAGYKLYDRVLRPSMVKVARAKSTAAPSTAEAADDEAGKEVVTSETGQEV